MHKEMKLPATSGRIVFGGKKFFIVLVALVLASPFSTASFKVLAADPVVDKEFVPGFNAYGRDNTVFLSACTRFTPTHSNYTSYFDLAVKNDLGAGYPIKASIRTAVDPTVPNTSALKQYTQSTFNNYAMSGNLFSRFTANDAQGLTLSANSQYFICIDDLTNDNATGWFYTASVSGGYTRMGYQGDVQPTFDGSFGYRTYYTPADTGGSTTTPGTSTSGSNSNTTSSSHVVNGSSPSSNISSAIKSPTNLVATLSDSQQVVLTWSASSTTTISGYNVYRSETAGSSFSKIGDTGKTTSTFNDSTIAAGKTYYYMVRAYKDSSESANSNEATITIPVTGTSVTATATKSTPWYKNHQVWLIAGLSVLLLVLIILLVVMIIKRKIAEKIKI